MKTAFDIIQVLRAFLNDECVEGIEKRCLWDVLTALRGPDEPRSYDHKARYTAYIRGYVLGPRRFYSYDVASEGPHPDILKQELSLRLSDPSTDSHFLYHMGRAIRWFTPKGITPHPNFRITHNENRL